MANEIKKIDAYHSLKPDVDTYGYENNPTWPEGAGTPPTESEIDAEVARLQAAYDAKKYQRDRKDKYPEIGDQLDNLYKDILAGKVDATGEFAKAIKAVKDSIPKP